MEHSFITGSEYHARKSGNSTNRSHDWREKPIGAIEHRYPPKKCFDVLEACDLASDLGNELLYPKGGTRTIAGKIGVNRVD